MLNKLLSTFKTRQPDTRSAAENEAAKSISTPEKAAELLAQLQAAVEIAEQGPNLARRNMLRRQRDEAALACRRHGIEAERQQVAAALQRDKASGEKDLEQAQKSLASADQVLTKQQDRHRAVLARLEPLESQLALAVQVAADQLDSAKTAFNAAVLKGDEPAEIAAAEKLYQMESEGKTAAGPLQLRLEAIRREEVDAKNALAAASQAKQDANNLILQARATLALVEYDRQAQALLEAYVNQAIAVRARGAVTGPTVHVFDMQVSSAERIVGGNGVSNGRLPGYVLDGLVAAMLAEPNLAILATRIEDIEEPQSEPLPASPNFDGMSPAQVA
jgi:hypothetical protein